MTQNKNIEFSIKGIFVTKFNIDLKEEFIKANVEANGNFSSYTFEIKCTNKGYVPNDLMDIEVFLKIFLDKEKNIELGRIQVNNIFEVKNLKRFYNEKANILNLPFELESMLVSFSLSHTRAITITKCAGTFLQNAILPILNPASFIKKPDPKNLSKLKA